MRTEVVRQRRARKRIVGLAPVVAAALGFAASAAAQSSTTVRPVPKVEVLTWDLMGMEGDSQPGAVIADMTGGTNRLWFVTKANPHIYRLELGNGKKVNKATWTSWSLAPGGVSSGIRRIKTSGDKRYVFVRTQATVERVDTQSCTSSGCASRFWILADDPNGVSAAAENGSDLAIDDNDGSVFHAVPATSPSNSYIERLKTNSSSNNVTHWYVGGSAGLCPNTADSTPCLSGVAVDRHHRDVVYYSEPGIAPDPGAISELNTRTNSVRRWKFSELNNRTGNDGVREPRQLLFDNDGTLWAVTGSGHLVSLDPKKSRMSKHRMPAAALGGIPGRDTYGVAPDGGLIGFTDATFGDPRVGMLMPDRQAVFVPAATPPPVGSATFSNPGTANVSERLTGLTSPVRMDVTGQITRNEDGTWSEGFTAGVVNTPLGLIPDQSARQGTFFFADGDLSTGTFKRIARIRLAKAELKGHDNRDDDDIDDDGKRADVDDDVDDDGIANGFDPDSDNDGIPDMTDDDDDDDGIEDSFDTKDKKERKQTSEQEAAPGASVEAPFMLSAGTLLAVASATSTDPLAQVKIEILDAAGNIVASSLAGVGVSAVTFVPPASGGDFIMRVKNQGVGTATISTKLLSRELWPVIF